MKLLATTPILKANTTAEATDFYQRLGFEAYPSAYETYLVMHRDGLELHFMTEEDVPLHPRSLHLFVQGVDDWYAMALDSIDKQFIAGEPKNQPYGVRGFTVKDPAGNYLFIGEYIWGYYFN